MVVHRRPTTRRSVARRSVPVDKLLFLRHRAKENMKFGVLFSSEGGFIHCWSLYGERHDMGMFYGPSKAGESILAMTTDATNQHFICGDTRGEIRVYNIEKYCCSITSPVHFESSPPPFVHSWQAHLASIIYCEWIDYKGNGEFLLTGSTDHTTRLWTMNGEQIGIFGQRQAWDVELLITTRQEKEEEQEEEDQVMREKSARKVKEDDRGCCLWK